MSNSSDKKSDKNNGLEKLKKSILKEKDAAPKRNYTIIQSPTENFEDRFEKANQFLTEKKLTKSPKPKLVTSTFSLPEEEYNVIVNTIKNFINSDIIIKQTEVLRIALKALDQLPLASLIEIYNSLIKVPVGKPRKNSLR